MKLVAVTVALAVLLTIIPSSYTICCAKCVSTTDPGMTLNQYLQCNISGDGHMSGIVLQSNTNRGISGAILTLSIVYNSWNFNTDSRGRFSIAIASGTYELKISKQGYKDFSTTIFIEEDEISEGLSFYLTLADDSSSTGSNIGSTLMAICFVGFGVFLLLIILVYYTRRGLKRMTYQPGYNENNGGKQVGVNINENYRDRYNQYRATNSGNQTQATSQMGWGQPASSSVSDDDGWIRDDAAYSTHKQSYVGTSGYGRDRYYSYTAQPRHSSSSGTGHGSGGGEIPIVTQKASPRTVSRYCKNCKGQIQPGETICRFCGH